MWRREALKREVKEEREEGSYESWKARRCLRVYSTKDGVKRIRVCVEEKGVR